jgi:hypothetical protein
LADAEARRKPHGGSRRGSVSRLPSFAAWYADRRPRRWKWGYFDTYVQRSTTSRRALEAVRQIDPGLAPAQIVYCTRSQYRDGDWILYVRLSGRGLLSTPQWVYVHRVVLVERRDRVYDRNFPFQAVQAYGLRHCPSPPFAIDRRFRKALRAAAGEFGDARTRRQIDGKRPSSGMLRLLARHYRSGR